MLFNLSKKMDNGPNGPSKIVKTEDPVYNILGQNIDPCQFLVKFIA